MEFINTTTATTATGKLVRCDGTCTIGRDLWRCTFMVEDKGCWNFCPRCAAALLAGDAIEFYGRDRSDQFPPEPYPQPKVE